jgi:hypothetical protein
LVDLGADPPDTTQGESKTAEPEPEAGGGGIVDKMAETLKVR